MLAHDQLTAFEQSGYFVLEGVFRGERLAFGRYWIKRMDNYFTQPLPADLLHTADPMKRQLLGLELRPGVASYHGDSEEYNRSRGEPGIDFPLPD